MYTLNKTTLGLTLMVSVILIGCLEDRVDDSLFNSNLAAADYWSADPKILSGGVGFADIIAVDIDEVNKEHAIACGC